MQTGICAGRMEDAACPGLKKKVQAFRHKGSKLSRARAEHPDHLDIRHFLRFVFHIRCDANCVRKESL